MANPRTDDVFVRCIRKEGFSHAKARRVAKRIRRATDDVVTEYHCDVCGYWHVGGDDKSKFVRAAQKRGRRGKPEPVRS